MSKYRPFESGTESESDVEVSGYSDYTGSESEGEGFVPPDRAELYRIGDPKIVAKALDNTIITNTNYSTYKKSGADDPLFGKTEIDYGSTTFKMAPKERQTMILVDSLNRDRTAYPQPTSLQLHLPRVYRNITSVAIQQLKLLTSFLYFRHNKYNTYFDILEEGRTIPGTLDPNILRVMIREGSYSLEQLFTELTYQMNTTPTFYYFSDGFNDFVDQFSATGDLSLNFNLPGDYYYNSLLEKYISNPSIDYIVTRYFSSRYTSQSLYTVNELQNAYYYPVLKEAFLDPEELMKLVLPTTGEDTYTRVVYGFEGLNDTYTLSIIQQNVAELDRYRTSKTFANALVNKYTWTSNAFDKRVNVSANGLNTSIINDINAQSNIITSNAIIGPTYGFSNIAAYNAFVTNSAKLNAVANSMYNYLQTQLATYFGVNIGTYDIATLASPNDFFYIQNGSNVEGVYTSYSIDYVNARNSNLLLSNLDFNYVPSSPIVQWPNMYSSALNPTIDLTIQTVTTNPASTIIHSGNFIINSNTYITNNIYDFTLSNFDSNVKVTTSTGIINASLKYGSADIVANVSSGKYVIIPIRSDVRQLLQVETMPRPYAFRYKDFTQLNYGGIIPFFFNKEYEYNTYSSIGTAEGSNSVYLNLTTADYGKNRAQISSMNPFTSTYTVNVLSNYKYFQINLPQPPSSIYGTDAVGFDYQLQLELSNSDAGSNFSTNMGLFLYHDRAAFMADAGQLRSENPLNYLSSYQINSVSSFNETIRVLGSNDYYVIVRPNDLNFQTTRFNLYTYWNDATSTPRKLLSNFNIQQPGISTFSEQYDFSTNGTTYSDTPSTVNYFFYKTYNSNYIRLPIGGFTDTPTDQKFNTVLSSGGPVIGYDDYDISNDLTDYKKFSTNSTQFLPTAQYGADPTNLFFFNNLSVYNSTAAVQSYFYGGSSNAVLTSTTLAPYTPSYSTITSREYKIVNYYDPTYIGPQVRDSATGWSINPAPSSLSTMSPYTSTTTNGYLSSLSGVYKYTYDADIGVSTLKIGEGVFGITFLPTEGVWDVTRFAFKSAYMGSADPNDEIEYIGIFDTNSVTNKSFLGIDIRSAFAVLKRQGKIVYNDSVRASTANFDPSMGTWYNFKLDTTFPYTRQDLIDQGMPGYTPYPCTIVSGEKNIYSAIAFKNDYTVTSYFMLTGTSVPFPYDTTPVVSSSYLGFIPTDNANVVVPTAYAGGQSYIKNIYQSQYEQSLPIGTQGLNYGSTLNLINDAFALKNYNPVYGQTGNPAYNLRTANYFEGSNQYLLFGDPANSNTGACDMYLVRNAGLSNKDTTYYSSMNLSNIIPLGAGEKIITWTANSDSLFAMSRPNPASYITNIYEISSLTNNPTCGLFQSLPLNDMRVWFNTGISFSTLYNVSTSKLYFDDTKNWMYMDYVMQGTTLEKGFIQYNNTPGRSTFTCGSYNIGEFRDINMSVSSPYSVYTQFIGGTRQEQDVQYFRLNTPARSTINTNGLAFTSNNALFYNPPASVVPPYSFNVSKAILNKREVFVLSDNIPNRFLRVDGNTTPLTLTASEASFDPGYLATNSFGYGTDKNGGIWFSLQTGNIFSSTPITIYGNSQLNNDIGVGIVNTAYQVFYPTMKIGLNRRTNRYNDITNTIDINYLGSNFNEYPKTQAFFYPNYSTLLNDVMSTNSAGSTVGWKWGQEKATNYFRADTAFQGFGFNSYIYNIPLSTNGPLTSATSTTLFGLNGNPNDYSYLAIRSYSPSEDYQVMIRLNCPNRYDYGVLNNQLLIGEISTAQGYNGGSALSNWNPNYVTELSQFNTVFSTTQTYGAGVILNFEGSTFSTTNYSSFYNIFSTVYNQYASSATVIANINSTINTNLFSYLSTNYGDIIPLSTLYTHARITDALQFDLRFSTSVASQIERRDTDWGLGYNLGFARSNYNGLTSYSAPTFYKILDDYIYLQLNESLSMNVLDTTNRENLSTAQESTGEVRKYFSKLLLGNYGNYSQTVIGTTVSFNPPVGKLDKFIFNWVDIDGNVINNADCDWSAVLLVNEQDQIATADSSLAKR